MKPAKLVPIQPGMIGSIAFGIALAAEFLAAVEAITTYDRLPPQVPLHFDLHGKPNSYGPPWMLIALFAVLELGCVVGCWFGQAAAQSTRGPEAVVFTTTASACLIAYVQHLVFKAAQSSDQKLPMDRFWAALGGFAVLSIFGSFFR